MWRLCGAITGSRFAQEQFTWAIARVHDVISRIMSRSRRFFHHQLTSTLSRIAGRALKPSYVYLASYLSGAELKKHTDREQCDYSITFCLDYSPEPKLATPWPICLQTPRGTVKVYQVLGDGLAYRGTQLPHFRAPLPEGQTSTSIFFHYVTAEFAGPLD